jgi:hypothetical protein
MIILTQNAILGSFRNPGANPTIVSYNASAGANPTIVSCNASAIKIYNATNSIVQFENKNIFFFF